MPQRSFKSIFVKLISFLILFTLVGTISSNIWERYLIQNELSDMKSNLYVLKETIYNVETAYDNLNHKLKGLAGIRDTKSSKPIPRESTFWTCADHRNGYDGNVFTNAVLEDLIKPKAKKSVGITKPKGTNSHPTSQNGFEFDTDDATTTRRHPRKAIRINSEPDKTDIHVSLKGNDKSIFKEKGVWTKMQKYCKKANRCKPTNVV